jgi:glycosyltransferase involved in cell wall biosynthesis
MHEQRPFVYDATHLASRLHGATATGIDWVDRAYARYLTQNARLACGLHYGLFAPHLLDPDFVATLSGFHRRKFDGADDRQWPPLRRWLTGDDTAPQDTAKPTDFGSSFAELTLTLRARLRDDRGLEIPKGAIYLNLAQHGFEYPRFFSWLDERPDVAPVFLVHDLLPLDYPEFFRTNYEKIFRARFETVLRRACALIATTPSTAERIEQEYRARGRRPPPLHAEPLASPLEDGSIEDLQDPQLAASDYFVMIATIEPRKNHRLLLDLWRDLARLEARPPKLVLVGGRGLSSAEVLDALSRSKSLSRHIRSVSGLTSESLRRLLANARALLAPSFAEGYGIPLVEALELKTPVICSDIPVFREVTQGCAQFISPLDGAGWRKIIADVAGRNALASPAGFKTPRWDNYFAGIEKFLASLR